MAHGEAPWRLLMRLPILNMSSGLILRGIFLGTRAEVDWFLNDMGRFFPEAHDRFTGHLDAAERGDLLSKLFQTID